MLSLAITFVVPSWINLKKKEVNAQATLWWSSAISLFMYMCLGLIPALSFVPDEEAGGNLLVTLMAYGNPLLLTKITCYMFSIVMLLPSIPVSCIVSFDNLHQNEICSKRAATFLAFVVTWIMAIPLQTGPGLKMFQDWMSLLFVSTANFIVPVLIYLKCERFRAEYNQDRTILSKKQLKILRIIHSHSKSILQWIDYMDTGILIKSPKALDDDPPAFDTLAPSKPNTSPELASILRNAVDRDLESVGVSRVIDHKGTLQSEYLSPKESFEVGNILMGSVPDPVQEELMIEKIQEKRASANVPSIAIVPASPPEVLIEEEISEDTKKTKWGISSIFGRKQNVGDGEAIDTSTRDSYLNFRELELSDPGFIKRMTLPVEAEFVSNTFRALPLWFTKRMRTRYVAWITGFFVFVITICNIGMLIEKLSRGEFD